MLVCIKDFWSSRTKPDCISEKICHVMKAPTSVMTFYKEQRYQEGVWYLDLFPVKIMRSFLQTSAVAVVGVVIYNS